MRKCIVLWLAWSAIASCSSPTDSAEPSIYTGVLQTYTLYQASDYEVSGTVNFYELNDGTIEVNISITPTENGLLHPVHIHLTIFHRMGILLLCLIL